MPTKDPSFLKKLKSLRKTYYRLLPYKISQVHDLWQKIQSQESSDADMDSLKRSLQAFADSGNTFGFSKLAQKAKQLLLLFEKINEDPASMDVDAVSQLFLELEHASHVVDKSLSWVDVRELGAGSEIIIENSELDAPIYWYGQDKNYADHIKRHLQHYGFRVRCFVEKQQLAMALKEHHPLTLIVDTVDEDNQTMDVSSFAKSLQQFCSEVPLIFLCPAGQPISYWLQIASAGAAAFFPKPVSEEALVLQLDRLTKKPEIVPYRILLLVMKSDLQQKLTVALEAGGIEVDHLSDPTNIMDYLADHRPDMILIQYNLGHFTGGDLAKILRLHEQYFDIPLVYYTDRPETDQEIVRLVLEGDDFIHEPVPYQDLALSLISRINRARTLHTMMASDALTGLTNHSNFVRQLETELARARRGTYPVTLALMDLDNFKELNHQRGHHVGDAVLRSFSTFLRRHLRRSDIVCRYGGDEFAVAMPNTDESTGAYVINRLREEFALTDHHVEGQVFRVSFSSGLAAFPELQNTSGLMQLAEEALEQAKKGGRNKVFLFSGSEGRPSNIKPMDEAEVTASYKAHIVVVDADQHISHLVQAFLESDGYSVHIANEGYQAKEIVAAVNPILVITDLMLFTGYDGFALCSDIRAMDINPGIILMSGLYKQSQFKTKAAAAGAEYFMEKPLDLKVLLKYTTHFYQRASKATP